MNMKKPKMLKAADDMKAGMPMPRFGARAMRPGGMAKGGKVKFTDNLDTMRLAVQKRK